MRQLQGLDLLGGTEGVADARHHRIDAAPLGFEHPVPGIAEVVGVVARQSLQGVDSRAAGDDIGPAYR